MYFEVLSSRQSPSPFRTGLSEQFAISYAATKLGQSAYLYIYGLLNLTFAIGVQTYGTQRYRLLLTNEEKDVVDSLTSRR
jgi:hypothetical protein